MLADVLQRLRLPTRQPPQTVLRRMHGRLAARGLNLPVRLPDGSRLGPDGRGYRIVLTESWAPRLLLAGDPAAGEAYLRNAIDVEGSMVTALRDLARDVPALSSGRPPARVVTDVLRLPRPSDDEAGRPRTSATLTGEVHSPDRDREAIRYHYDVGNDFYRLFLDHQLVYSCAYFPDGTPLDPPDGPDDGLDAAQTTKLDLICRKLDLQPGERLLDIGCGWGALAIHAAAHYGVEVVGVTLSAQQVALARERADQAGVDGRVEFRLADYREITGTFDAVASIGMFEHVGTDQLERYFATCHGLTRPGGRFLNHGITTGQRGIVRDLAHDDGFVARYVFPDGALVPAHTAVAHLERAGFEVVDLEQLRPHYARTLSRWVARLEANADSARTLAGERTYRIWRAYMAASTVGFDTGDLGVIQLLGTRPPTGLPLRRDRMLLPRDEAAVPGPMDPAHHRPLCPSPSPAQPTTASISDSGQRRPSTRRHLMSRAAHAAPTPSPGSLSSGTAVPRSHPRAAGLRLPALLAAVLLTMLWTAGPAAAHGEQSDEAAVLVRQAIALIVSSPGDLGEIREKVKAAQEALDTTGVDLALVEQADSALTDDADLTEVRALLERSIGAGPVGAPTPDEPAPATTDPATTDPATTPVEDATEGMGMATGAEPGDTMIAEPLEPRPTLDATDWALLAGSILLGLVGVWTVLRFRPVPATTKR